MRKAQVCTGARCSPSGATAALRLLWDPLLLHSVVVILRGWHILRRTVLSFAVPHFLAYRMLE